MGTGFYLSKPVALVCGVLGVGALATIIALSVVYSQEKAKNNDALTTIQPTVTTAGPNITTAGPNVTTAGPNVTTAAPNITTPTPPTGPWQLYRLPDALTPLSYNVTLWPRLKPDENGLYIFSGNSRVTFRCDNETDLIIIHSSKLNLTEFGGHHAQLTGLNGVAAPALKRTWLEVPTQYLVIQLNSSLQANSSYELFTEFTGELSDDLGGLYRSEYTENETQKVLATTQMQATYARQAFPCFDEPAMKAVFYITLIHTNDTVALGNGMSNGDVPITIDGEDLLQTSFEPTEIMSTYLLAFVVCEFGSISSMAANNVSIRIWARKTAIDEGQGDYALNITGPILSFFEDYYNSTYPLEKSDQIALPDFSAGAMENWGLITYRETALLYNPGVSSNGDKEWVATVIAHELAHMWFGNLVTMRWWNDLWLNEGFATYVSYLGADYAEPTWGMRDLIVLNVITGVMGVDALSSSHPLSSTEEDVQTPEDITQLFDSITYNKGAAVLRMLSEFITEEVFTAGLHTYLEEYKYQTTSYMDLWKHLQLAVDNSTVELPHSLEDIMNRWILQMGFPLITIDTSIGNITQKHFLLDPESAAPAPSQFNYEWIIPLTYMKPGGNETTYWLNKTEDNVSDMVHGTSGWLLVNINMKGFYRVNYDEHNWDLLLTQLQTDPEPIPVINRAQIIDDAFNLARAKEVNTTLALQTTLFLSKEVEYMPWEIATRNLDYFYLMFDRSEVYEPMQAYMKKQVTPLFEHFKSITVNWTKIPDNHTDQYNQVNAISIACRTGVTDCKDQTTLWFEEWMNTSTSNPIHANLRATVYCNAIANGGQDEWDFAWKMFNETETASEAEKLMYGLSCANDTSLLERYLNYSLDPTKIRKQDAISVIVDIASNVVGQSLAWNFTRDNWGHIVNNYGGGISFGSLITGVSRRFSSEEEYQELEQFKKDNEHQLGTAATAVDQALERTRININWVNQNKEEVLDWFTTESTSP